MAPVTFLARRPSLQHRSHVQKGVGDQGNVPQAGHHMTLGVCVRCPGRVGMPLRRDRGFSSCVPLPHCHLCRCSWHSGAGSWMTALFYPQTCCRLTGNDLFVCGGKKFLIRWETQAFADPREKHIHACRAAGLSATGGLCETSQGHVHQQQPWNSSPLPPYLSPPSCSEWI